MIVKLRTQKVTIELPIENSDAWVRAVLQKIVKDDNYQTVQTVDRIGAVHRKFSDFATVMLTVDDPLQGSSVTLSGAALGLAVSELIKRWILADEPNTWINADGDIIKE